MWLCHNHRWQKLWQMYIYIYLWHVLWHFDKALNFVKIKGWYIWVLFSRCDDTWEMKVASYEILEMADGLGRNSCGMGWWNMGWWNMVKIKFKLKNSSWRNFPFALNKFIRTINLKNTAIIRTLVHLRYFDKLWQIRFFSYIVRYLKSPGTFFSYIVRY